MCWYLWKWWIFAWSLNGEQAVCDDYRWVRVCGRLMIRRERGRRWAVNPAEDYLGPIGDSKSDSVDMEVDMSIDRFKLSRRIVDMALDPEQTEDVSPAPDASAVQPDPLESLEAMIDAEADRELEARIREDLSRFDRVFRYVPVITLYGTTIATRDVYQAIWDPLFANQQSEYRRVARERVLTSTMAVNSQAIQVDSIGPVIVLAGQAWRPCGPAGHEEHGHVEDSETVAPGTKN